MKKYYWLLAVSACLFSLPGFAQQHADSIAAPRPAPPHERLSGALFGTHEKLKENGIHLLFSSTHFYQGLMSGSGEHEFEYGGKGDAFLIVDGKKLGIWKGFGLVSHGEIRYGKNPFKEGGNLIPANTAMLFPDDSGTKIDLTSLFFIQKFGQKTKFILGRLNTLDFLALNHYYGGRGIDGFQNLAFTAPPMDARTTPLVTLGAMAIFDLDPLEVTLGAWDSQDRTHDYGFSGLFENGISVTGELAFKPKPGGREGRYSLGGTWSNLEATSLSQTPRLLLPQATEPLAEIKGSWVVDLTFEQNLFGPKEKPAVGWGIFGRAGISDGNPNPFRWSAMGGFAGCPFTKRPRDRFGLAYYKFGVSPDLKDGPLLALIVQNEQGVEGYYDFALVPWFNLTADVQFIDPFRKPLDNAWYGGLRAKIKL